MEFLQNDKKSLWANLFSMVLILLFLAGTAFAADSTWNGGTGNWNASGNWTPSVVPNGSSYNVFIDGGNIGINSFVNLDTSATIGNLTVDTGDTLDIDNGHILTMGLNGGSIINNGNISLSSSGSGTYLRIGATDVLLTGTGILTLGNQANNFIDASTNGNRLTNDTNHTIQGSGTIGQNQMNLTNLGTITANQPTNLTIDPYAGVTNSGTFRVNNGSTLIVTDNLTNYSTNTLTGGIYDVAGILKLPVPTTETIATNAATIILDGPSSAIVRYSGGANALTGFATNAATGDFTIKNGRNFTTAGAFSNAGKMTFETGSDFTVGASQNYIQAAGLTTVNGSLIAALVDIQAGILKGAGTITGNVTINGGTVQPGNSPGIMNIIGDYSQSADSTLDIEILNTVLASGGYDQLSITGTASLAGTLNVSLLPGAVISDGDTFNIIHYASFSSEFSNYVGPFDTSEPFYFTYNYLPNDLVLTAHGAVPLPPSLLLFGSGLLSIGVFARKKFKRQ